MENCSKNWKEIFVYESGMIDPQPDYPSLKPGQIMFDNHLNALNYSLLDNSLTEHTPTNLHKLLTKNVDFFEIKDNSGKYRTVDIWIGHNMCPSPSIIPNLMQKWYDITCDLLEKNYLETISGIEVATISHNMFECVHPFIDGNGRTGRLLFNMILRLCGEDPRIFYFKDRFNYYDEIQLFRNSFFSGTNFLVDHLYDCYSLPPMEN